MKRGLIASMALIVAAGCTGSGDEGGPVKPTEMLNPSGQPKTAADTELTRQNAEAGNRANAEMEAAARAMREAQSKSGGK